MLSFIACLLTRMVVLSKAVDKVLFDEGISALFFLYYSWHRGICKYPWVSKESRPYCKVLLLFLWIEGYEMINRLIHWTNWMRVKETKELRHTKRGQGSSGPPFSPFHRDFLLYCSNRRRKAHQSAFSAFTYPRCLELCRDGKAWLFAGCWSTASELKSRECMWNFTMHLWTLNVHVFWYFMLF